MEQRDLAMDLDELSSAEDFLDYFGIDYDPAVVHVNRLHILQRFHDYVAAAGDEPMSDDLRFEQHADLLRRAYDDFVCSDALTEKVFKVFHDQQSKQAFVPITQLKSPRS